MDRFDPFVKYADVYGEIINWEKDPMNKPQNQNKYFFSDGKTYYEQICKMLRLMSVFKQAFNQIYDNEDEIHNAWENFVNNLSASAVIGTEPDVTLTWNDGSVNFEFTMVPGEDGQDGVGITSISFNSDYTMTITLSNGQTYTSMSLKGDTGATGETGPQGPQGAPGEGLKILDVYPTLNDLQTAHPTGQPGDAYQVGSAESYTLYIWSSSQSAWVPAGSLGAVSPSLSNPLMDGTASAGSQNLYSRGDHVHPTDTSRASQEELDALIKTSQALIDQSFTYRESPAIQNSLARIDKIKGNTLVWNQLANINFSTQTTFGITYTNNNDGSLKVNGTATGTSYIDIAIFDLVKDHEYYIFGCADGGASNTYRLDLRTADSSTVLLQIFDKTATYISSLTGSCGFFVRVQNGTTVNNLTYQPQIVDLTMLGLSLDQFLQFFPLSYYSYDTGSLLSFKGEGIKTVGKNFVTDFLADSTTANISWTQENGVVHSFGLSNGTTRTLTYTYAIPLKKGSYILSGCTGGSVSTYGLRLQINRNGSWGALVDVYSEEQEFTLTEDSEVRVTGRFSNIQTTNYDVTFYPMIRYADAPSGFEPYISSTTNLPISTYFPQGMNRVNDVYDELTQSKATKRIGSRAYQSGDESDTSVLTDGTTTLYELSEYEETPITPSLDLTFNAYERGTEELLPVNGSVPVTSPIIADMTYMSIDDVMTYILNKLDGIPSEIVQKLSEMESDISALEDDVSALQTASSELETDVETLSTTVNGLSGTVMSHTNSISTINTDISGIQADMVSLNIGVTGANRRIGLLETADTRIEGKADANTAEITAIKTGLVKSVARTLNINDVTASGTLDSNSAIDVETGYTFLGIIGTRLTHSGDNEFSSYMLDIEMIEYYLGSNDTPRVRYKIRNFSATDISGVRLYLTMLCVKTS